MSKKSRKKARNAAVMILFALMLVVPMFSESVYAEYKSYKVTLLAGKYGKIIDPSDGQQKDKVEITFYPDSDNPNERIWTPADYEVVVTDDRYYCNNEYHISGIEGVATAQEINEDMVFVATYRIKGDLVEYTVHYVDEDGAQLPGLPDGIFHGNIGEDAVLAYKYCEGYLPDTYTQSRTLDANPANNEFIFTYHKVSEGGGGTTIIYEEGEPVVTPGGTVEPADNTEPTEPVVPDEPVIIDDPTVPQTEPIVDPEPTVKPEPDKPDQPFVPMAILIGGGILLLLALFLLLLLRRRKKQEKQQ